MKKILVVIAIAMSILSVGISKSHAVEDGFGFNSLNGVVYYIPALESLAAGTGLELASFKQGLIGVRAEVVSTTGKNITAQTLYGTTVGVNIPKLIEELGGIWAASIINPSLNVGFFTKLDGKNSIYPAVGVNIIQIPLK